MTEPGASAETLNLARVLAFHRVDVVLDLYANLGQHAQRLRQGGYRGRIVSFEPLDAVHAALKRTAGPDPLWDVPPPLAFGDREGEVTLLVSPEADMSSALPLTQEAAAFLDGAVPTATQSSPMARLDALFATYVRKAERAMVRIDTQGTELQVLEGASGVIDRVHALQVRLALIPAYSGEPGWKAVLAKVESLGFAPAMFLPGHFNLRAARQFSMDGVFVRRR